MAATTKNDRVDLRIPSDQKRLIERAAAMRGQTVSDFIRGAAVEGARSALQGMDVTVLSARDRDRFLAILDEADAQPNAALQRAAEHYRTAVG